MTALTAQARQTLPDVATEREIALKGIRAVRRLGLFVAIFFVFGGLLWAAFAPLSLAVMAPGVVVVEGSRRAVQHLEGGIVSEILVKNGDVVHKGDPLIRLASAQSNASLGVLRGQLDAQRAQAARLVAERDGKDEVIFPKELLDRADQPSASDSMNGQISVFKTRRASLDGRISIVSARREQAQRAIDGYNAQLSALTRQIALIKKELAGVQELFNKGLERQPRLLELQRNAADLDGRIGQIKQQIASTQLDISQDELQIADLRATYVNEAVGQLREAQTQVSDLESKLSAADDVAHRLDVIAPVDGIAVSMGVHALGQVIKPGETLMEIVPESEGLVVSAHVRPEDAEDLHVGEQVEVYLTAYHQRRLPQILGTVTYVSADRITEERTGQSYYEIRAKVDPESLANAPMVSLRAGMPADLAIKTGETTVLASIVRPITGVLERGFREP